MTTCRSPSVSGFSAGSRGSSWPGARHGGDLVGYAFGMPLRPSTHAGDTERHAASRERETATCEFS